MSHRYRSYNDGKIGFLIVWILLIGLAIPLLIFNVGDTREVEREIYIEGTITEKNIEKGFGSAYIFVLNGTTDLQVNRWQYDSFSVGDYLIVYIVFLGYELVRVEQ